MLTRARFSCIARAGADLECTKSGVEYYWAGNWRNGRSRQFLRIAAGYRNPKDCKLIQKIDSFQSAAEQAIAVVCLADTNTTADRIANSTP
jgi:hypothetical protein